MHARPAFSHVPSDMRTAQEPVCSGRDIYVCLAAEQMLLCFTGSQKNKKNKNAAGRERDRQRQTETETDRQRQIDKQTD